MAVARRTSSAVTAFLPFVFSAYSKSSLIGNLERVYEYLKGSSELLNLRDLAYTLSSRRTDFQFAAAVAAASVEDLSRKIANIKDVEKNAGESGNSQIFRRSHTQVDRPRFLGIFVSISLRSLTSTHLVRPLTSIDWSRCSIRRHGCCALAKLQNCISDISAA